MRGASYSRISARPASTSTIDTARTRVTFSPSQSMPISSAKRMLVSRSAATIGIGATVNAQITIQ